MVTSGHLAPPTPSLRYRDCMADSVPIVVICGQVPTKAIGTDAFQEAPVSAIMGAVAKHVFLVTDPTRAGSHDAQRVRACKNRATGARGDRYCPRTCKTGRGSFRAQVSWHFPVIGIGCSRWSTTPLPTTPASASIPCWRSLERPLIYAGGGVINANASKAMRHFANAFGLPVTTTLMALGASDTTHPLSLHMLGMHGTAFANYAVEDCDFLIAIGGPLRRSSSRRSGTLRAEREAHRSL